jgi:hypothetical protein
MTRWRRKNAKNDQDHDLLQVGGAGNSCLKEALLSMVPILSIQGLTNAANQNIKHSIRVSSPQNFLRFSCRWLGWPPFTTWRHAVAFSLSRRHR